MTTFWDRLKPTQITSWADQVEQEDLMTQDTLTVAEFATCVANLVNRCVLDPEAASSAFHFQMDDMYIDIMARSQLIISISHVKYDLPKERQEDELLSQHSTEQNSPSATEQIELKNTPRIEPGQAIYVFKGNYTRPLTQPIYTCRTVKEAVRFARSHTPCHAYEPATPIIYNFDSIKHKGCYRKVTVSQAYSKQFTGLNLDSTKVDVGTALPGAQTVVSPCLVNPFDVLANDEIEDDR